ncbi:hypothetical protein LQ567_24510 [Niabella pedocola]|uniref:Uncharacterized protein n=1 Tax=Niabella pedocola TaxID=1752077 RepID=A0ABS8PY25_9BACT|nr:hypothetical protein [Niabella pedocola]MCD2425969.1 hypothetical protein [Niabella pedocola]
MENNNEDKRPACNIRIAPKEGKRRYELRIGSMLQTPSLTEQADIDMEVTLCCSLGHAEGVVYTICFSRPRFNGMAEYNKEQWIYTKIFDIHRNLVLRVDKAGRIKEVLNREAILEAWMKVRRDLSASAFGRDTGLLHKIAAFEAKLRTDLEAVYRHDLFFQWLCNDMYGTYKNAGASRTTGKQIGGFIGATDITIAEEKQVLLAEENKILIEVSGSLVSGETDLNKLNHALFLQVGATGSQELLFSYSGHYLFADRSGFFDQTTLSVGAVVDRIYNRRLIYSLNAII